LTGIDFYHQLDDELENKLESTKNQNLYQKKSFYVNQ